MSSEQKSNNDTGAPCQLAQVSTEYPNFGKMVAFHAGRLDTIFCRTPTRHGPQVDAKTVWQ